MRRSRVWLAGAATASLLLPGCSQTCTMMGPPATLWVKMPAEVRGLLHTIRVTICSDDDCRSFEGPAEPSKTAEPMPGLQPVGQREFFVDWDVPSSWRGDEAALIVEGIDRDEGIALRHEETFTFETSYPNGKDCDGDGFPFHRTSLSRSDLVR